jgi:hypothetical protein
MTHNFDIDGGCLTDRYWLSRSLTLSNCHHLMSSIGVALNMRFDDKLITVAAQTFINTIRLNMDLCIGGYVHRFVYDNKHCAVVMTACGEWQMFIWVNENMIDIFRGMDLLFLAWDHSTYVCKIPYANNHVQPCDFYFANADSTVMDLSLCISEIQTVLKNVLCLSVMC